MHKWFAGRWQSFFRVAGCGAAILLLQHLDPFGLTAASEQQSVSAYLGVVAPFYRGAAQQAITVVLIDDGYLDRVGVGWPLPYRMQGDLLRRVLLFEPRAVFIDLLYERSHGALNANASAVDRARDFVDALGGYLNDIGPTGIPVMLAQSSRAAFGDHSPGGCGPIGQVNAPDTDASLLPELDLPGFQRAYVGWRGCGTSYPLLLSLPTDLPTPAFALYRDAYCRSSQLSAPDRQNCEIARDRQRAKEDFSTPMIVRWGSVPSNAHAALFAEGGQGCQRSKADTLGRLRLAWDHMIASFAQSLSSSATRGARLPCPYIDTISASWLLGAHAEQLETLLKGRMILIGADIAAIGDSAQSPVNGQVAAVVWHAMALDNLITSGRGYLREIPARAVAFIEAGLLLGFLWIWIGFRQPESAQFEEPVAPAPRFSVRSALSLVLWFGLGISLLFWHEWRMAVIILMLGTALDFIKPHIGFEAVMLCAATLVINTVAMAVSYAPVNWVAIVAGVSAALALFGTDRGVQSLHPESLLWLSQNRLRSRGDKFDSGGGAPRAV
jgi:CHASE2 domain-containing sensor protein